MEQWKAMEYESGKASSDVLKPRYIYKIFVYYNGCLHPSYKYANLLRERKLPQAILVTTKQTGNYVKRNNYKFLLFLKYQHDVQQAHPASYSMDSRYFPSTWWVKRSRRKADQSHSLSTEVENEWSYTSTTLHVFMSWEGATLP